ncbi:MAG: non-homologous end-joining DNA ligase [Dehalococcoidia bacterium]|nr:non-homologous end-joining DNA ligase [Dehalococcoidia bacterium]
MGRTTAAGDAGGSNHAAGDGPATAPPTVTITHADRLLWPAEAITKGDLADYYREVAPLLLRYAAGRPATLVVFPRGRDGPSYYRRDRPSDAPAWIGSVSYSRRSAPTSSTLILLAHPNDLLWFVNRGAIEVHLWMARLPDLEHPDQLVFDLDPGDDAPWEAVLECGRLLHALLSAAGIESVAKTSGGRGLHVYVPIAPGPSFEEVRQWAKAVADHLAAARPDLVSVSGGATHRGQRVTIDYAQNSIGKNMAAPYTVRARPGAPVSTPLTWEEVHAGAVHPSQFTVRTIRDRLAQVGDVFAAALSAHQRLPAPPPPP